MGNVPELRFHCFKDQWNEISIGSIYHQIVVGFVGTVAKHYCEKEDGVQFIRTLNVKNGYFSPSKVQYVTKSFHRSNKKSQLKNGDILIARVGANMGMVCKVKGLDGEANSANVVIIKNQDNLSSDFFTKYLTSNYGQRQIRALGAGGAQEVLNISVVKTIRVPNPNLLEQQKIANFISSVDDKISLLTEKHSLLQRYKKGVMQKLFSQELRFKDVHGNDFPDWEKSTLGKISSKPEYGMNKAAVEFDGNSKYIRITDIDDITRKFTPRPLVSPSGGQDDNYKVKYGDILFARTGASVGKSYLYDNDDGNLFFAGFLIRFSITEADPYFIFQQTKGQKFDKWVRVMSMRSGQPGINANEYASFEILLPELKEQQKIANFLSKIDKKIDSVAQQIEQNQTFKKGLLQKMFV